MSESIDWRFVRVAKANASAAAPSAPRPQALHTEMWVVLMEGRSVYIIRIAKAEETSRATCVEKR
jgi:hypothetical protein